MHDCICGASALHIKIERRKEKIGNTTFTFAPEHRVECRQKCGKAVRGSTAKETKTLWNEHMKKLKADAAAALPAPESAS